MFAEYTPLTKQRSKRGDVLLHLVTQDLTYCSSQLSENQKLLRGLSSPDQIASALFAMAFYDRIEDSDLKEVGFWAREGLELADAGYVEESREQIVNQMATALDRAATAAAATWSAGPWA